MAFSFIVVNSSQVCCVWDASGKGFPRIEPSRLHSPLAVVKKDMRIEGGATCSIDILLASHPYFYFLVCMNLRSLFKGF
jgi:hypothetical protein